MPRVFERCSPAFKRQYSRGFYKLIERIRRFCMARNLDNRRALSQRRRWIEEAAENCANQEKLQPSRLVVKGSKLVFVPGENGGRRMIFVPPTEPKVLPFRPRSS